MKLRLGLLLPALVPVEWQINQRLLGLRVRFGDNSDIFLIVLGDSAVPSDEECSDASVRRFDVLEVAVFDEIVAFDEDAPTRVKSIAKYKVSAIGRVVPWPEQSITVDEYGELTSHIFNRLGPRGKGELDYCSFHYFPYGYLFRFVGLGLTDPFGHRIEGNFRNWRVRGNTRLVVCLGGSAVWGMTTLPEQCFPSQLEMLLNAHRDRDSDSVKVLNFGVPGGVVLNAIERFILFCADLRPDVVILHDGINDLFYGMTSDQWLLSRHDIAYQQNLEVWADLLHGRGENSAPLHAGRLTSPKSGNQPIAILMAYLRRKRELVAICRAFGAHVVTGLQPYSGSKQALSPIEARRIRAWAGEPNIYAAEFTTIDGLYRMMTREKPGLGGDAHVNFHAEFGAYGPGDTLFNDMVHLSAAGEAIVAASYAKVIDVLIDGKPDDET